MHWPGSLKTRFAVASEGAIRRTREFLEDQWFDRTRRVHTSGEVLLDAAGIPAADRADSEQYQPARPAHIREAFRAVPAADLSPYSCIDLGSGKGRALFIAAEFPFREIVGVEFSPLLHAQASRNIRSFRRVRGTASHRTRENRIVSLHGNALDYTFPPHPLVLYFFNPFGAATMRAVLQRLADSLHQQPRHAVVVLLWQQCASLLEVMEGMQRVVQTNRLHIFEAHRPA